MSHGIKEPHKYKVWVMLLHDQNLKTHHKITSHNEPFETFPSAEDIASFKT